ncbi:MAG: hypothetical protein ACI308_04415 [Muribaculaceae bacterium]
MKNYNKNEMRNKMVLIMIMMLLSVQPMLAQDNMHGSWLPHENEGAYQGNPLVKRFMAGLHGSFRPMVCRYDGAVLRKSLPFSQSAMQLPEATWKCHVEADEIAKGVLDVTVDYTLEHGTMDETGVALAFDFSAWSRDNYLLLPAYVYNGNRFHVETEGYCAPFPTSYYHNAQAPLLFSNSPRLSEDVAPGKIEGLTGNMATPALCFYSPAHKQGCIILFEQRSRFGNYGVIVEENDKQNRATMVISAPGVRELAAGFGSFAPSGDSAAVWKGGDSLRMHVRIYRFGAKGIPDLLNKFMDVRKELTGENEPRNLCPFSYITELTTQYKNKERWLDKGDNGAYYRMENSSDGYQVGWVGGLMGTYGLLAIDDPMSRSRVMSTFDYVLNRMCSESGYLYGTYKKDQVVSDRDGIPGAALVRKNADALFFMIKHFMLLERQGYGHLVRPQWKKAAYGVARAFVNTWEKYGELGNYVDVRTGDIIIHHTTSGAIAPAGLVLASMYFDDDELLTVAKEIAAYYYKEYVAGLGLTCAHSGDILQDADADSAYGLVESMMALYEATNDKAWLSKAQTTAQLAATWTLSYDYYFPPTSTLGKLGAHAAGAIWASVQNKHAAPGICTSSGDYLFKLYRATGQQRYADLLRDIEHAHAEVMETPGRVTTGMGPGSSMERIQTSDAEGKGLEGFIYKTSDGWTEDCGMLMALEIPGIYVQTNRNVHYVFDHLQVQVMRPKGKGVVLRITNPTRFDAVTTIFAETAEQARKPMGYTAFMSWQKVAVKAGQTVELTVGK